MRGTEEDRFSSEGTEEKRIPKSREQKMKNPLVKGKKKKLSKLKDTLVKGEKK